MAKMTMKEFERSKFDKEPKGVKEGSKKDIELDKKQLKAVNKERGYAKGGKIDGKHGKPETKAPMGKACGGKVKGHAAGGVMRGTGAATKGKRFSYDG